MPFFWSDQGRHRIQFLGRSATTEDDDVVEVVVGEPDEHRFLALYGRGGRLRGVLGVNVPRLVMPYRSLLDERRELGRRAGVRGDPTNLSRVASGSCRERRHGSIPFDA